MGSLIFSDYRMIYRFLTACQEDVLRLECGRRKEEGMRFSQGRTVQCLSGRHREVSEICRQEIQAYIFDIFREDGMEPPHGLGGVPVAAQ